MQEHFTTEDFMEPIECLTEALDSIQHFYDTNRIEDRENAKQLINSYKTAIELLKKVQHENPEHLEDYK